MAINPDLTVERFDILELKIGPYLLRQLRLNDEQAVVDQYNDEAIVQWLEFPNPFLPEYMSDLVDFFKKDQEDGNGCWWIIEEDGIVQGQIWFSRQNWKNKTAHIGYLAFPAARGKGMVPYLVKELSEIALLEYKMSRVEIRCHVENVSSARVAEKAGYKYEGVLRKALVQRGVAYDIKIFSLTHEDLVSRQE